MASNTVKKKKKKENVSIVNSIRLAASIRIVKTPTTIALLNYVFPLCPRRE
jgi:hypothetical protein